MPKRKDKNTERDKALPNDYIDHMNKNWTISLETTSGITYVDFAPITDGVESEIIMRMAQDGFTNWRWCEKSIRILANRDRYSRYEMWLSSLTPSDGGQIDMLAAKFDTTDNEMFNRYLKIWLVNAIGRIFNSNRQNPMLVLSGAQGSGKSAFARWLAPYDDMFVEQHINPDSKEDMRLLASKLVWEAGELGATTRKADVESLKAFMTKSTAEIRLPYDKHMINLPALASFIGTVNPGDGFLNDASGSRRFHVVDVNKIDWSYREMKVVEIWSNALWLYANGYDTRLTDEEVAKRDGKNEEHAVDNPISWIFNEYFTITGNPSDTIMGGEIVSALSEKGYSGSPVGIGREIGRLMQLCGVESSRMKKGTAYTGVRRKFTGD